MNNICGDFTIARGWWGHEKGQRIFPLPKLNGVAGVESPEAEVKFLLVDKRSMASVDVEDVEDLLNFAELYYGVYVLQAFSLLSVYVCVWVIVVSHMLIHYNNIILIIIIIFDNICILNKIFKYCDCCSCYQGRNSEPQYSLRYSNNLPAFSIIKNSF